MDHQAAAAARFIAKRSSTPRAGCSLRSRGGKVCPGIGPYRGIAFIVDHDGRLFQSPISCSARSKSGT